MAAHVASSRAQAARSPSGSPARRSARPNPHDPAYQETALSCLHTILEEEWEHHRYAVRDLDAVEAGAG